MKNKSLSKAMLNCKCPRCRTGNIFTYRILEFKKVLRTNKNCPHCNLKFEKRYGFYGGAMYFSYAFAVIIFVMVSIVLNLFLEETQVWHYVLSVGFLVVFLAPFIYRYSRMLTIYIMGGFKFIPEI